MRDLVFERYGERLSFSRDLGGGPTLGTVIAEFSVGYFDDAVGGETEVKGSVVLSRTDVLDLIEYLKNVAAEAL